MTSGWGRGRSGSGPSSAWGGETSWGVIISDGCRDEGTLRGRGMGPDIGRATAPPLVRKCRA